MIDFLGFGFVGFAGFALASAFAGWAWKVLHELGAVRRDIAELRYELVEREHARLVVQPLEQLNQEARTRLVEPAGDGVGLSSGVPVAIRGQR